MKPELERRTAVRNIERNENMPTQREVLAVLGRDDLFTCLGHVGLEVRNRLVRDDLVEALAASKRAPFDSRSKRRAQT